MATPPFAVTVTTAATQIIAENPQRTSIYLENNDATEVLFLGQDATVTTANGIAIAGGGLVVEDMGHRLWKGPWFGIVGAGTVDVRVWERTDRG